MFNDCLTLVKTIESVDDYGIPRKTQTEKVVFCRVLSIGQTEFYQAAASGLKPEI